MHEDISTLVIIVRRDRVSGRVTLTVSGQHDVASTSVELDSVTANQLYARIAAILRYRRKCHSAVVGR
jgi:hypothetical protein